jgi:hypothetical protein
LAIIKSAHKRKSIDMGSYKIEFKLQDLERKKISVCNNLHVFISAKSE